MEVPMMDSVSLTDGRDRSRTDFALRFTPAEWRFLLKDAGFLRDPDNSYQPRRLMGVPVQIVHDHGTC